MKITKIESQKKTRGRVNIFIDGEFSFGLSENNLVLTGLFQGREIDRSEIEKIKNMDNLSKCMEKAYRFLSFRVRSEKEMRDKLLERFSEETVTEALIKLKDYKYVDDYEFTRIWVSSRSSSRGKKALFMELVKKGVSREIIEDALGAVSSEEEFETALGLVRSKEKYLVLNKNEAYKKVSPFLMRRGYSYEVIKKVISEIYAK